MAGYALYNKVSAIRFLLYTKKRIARMLVTSLILGVERSDFVRFLEIIFLKFESKIEMLTWVLSKSQK